MTKRAPGKRFYHDDKHVPWGSGCFSDSLPGSKEAHARGYRWIDNNGHVMHRTAAGRDLGVEDKNLIWVNAHGAPYNPSWLKKGDKFEHHSFGAVHRKHPRLRTARQTFAQNNKLGLSTEWDVKDIHPFSSRGHLVMLFAALADDAKAGYGDDWQKRVQVKMLSNLGGGLPFAYRVLKAAHEAGFTTILLSRGRTRFKTISKPWLTYVRGGRCA